MIAEENMMKGIAEKERNMKDIVTMIGSGLG